MFAREAGRPERGADSPRVLLAVLVILAGASAGRAWAQAGRTPASDATKSDATRAGDRAAIRAAMQSFARAFESGDARAVAGHWTAEGEYANENGLTLHGREALEQGYAEFFKKTAKPRVELDPESLRFLGQDSAVDEGRVTVRGAEGEPATVAHYNALFVRENGRWLIALLRESPAQGGVVRDLSWLLGDWRTTGPGTEIITTYAWDPNKVFLHARFTIKEKDRTLSGLQVIGRDPATDELKSWTFEAEGGVGEAVWHREGTDEWVVEAVGTLTDGRTLTATNILKRINEDTFTWQSTNRALDDEPLDDLPPVKVTRVKPAK